MINKFIEAFHHPNEIGALYKLHLKYKAFKPDKRPLNVLANALSDKEFCFVTLSKVSRSFSVVIQQLPEELKDVICVFYLVLRALDSIEDDTSSSIKIREQVLREFHEYLNCNGKNISGIGDKADYRILLENFHKVINCFQSLDPKYQDVIVRICREMGEGMIQYLDKEILEIRDYDAYCYYVAGLVGVGLTELFVLSGLQNPGILKHTNSPISMGLFLQKTNIIRDYLEDINENRTFWPEEIWGKYSKRLDDFVTSDSKEGVYCLNHMITDALRHAPDCLLYLKQIQNPDVFHFCAIPQVMAIATLAEVFNNPDVFRKNVKIRKGLTASLIFKAYDYAEVEEIFHVMANSIFDKTSLDDPNVQLEVLQLQKILGIEYLHENQKIDAAAVEESLNSPEYSYVYQ